MACLALYLLQHLETSSPQQPLVSKCRSADPPGSLSVPVAWAPSRCSHQEPEGRRCSHFTDEQTVAQPGLDLCSHPESMQFFFFF